MIKKRVPRAEQAKAQDIFAKILEQAHDFSRKDIKKWRQAIEIYKSPRDSSSLYDLQIIYADLMMDGHIDALIRLRKAAILNTPVIVDIEGERNDEYNTKVNSDKIYLLIDYILDSIFTGTEVLEFTEVLADDFTIARIPKTNTNPRYKRIFLKANELQKFIDYSLPIFTDRILQVGTDDNIGVVNNIVPQLIWSRFAEQSWSEYAERFGMPMILAQSNKTNRSEVNAIENKLKGLAEGVTGVLPIGTTIDIKHPTNSDAYNVYLQRIKLCEEKIAKQVVGGTTLIDKNNNRGQTEVHERNLDDKITAMDIRYVEQYLNKAFDLLRKRGYDFPENAIVKLDVSDSLEYIELLNFATQLQGKYKIPAAWIDKTFGIPVEELSPDTKPVPPPKKLATGQYRDFNSPTAEVHAVGVHGVCNICGGIVEDKYSAKANNLVGRLRTYFSKYAEKIYKREKTIADDAELITHYSAIFEDGLSQHFDYGDVNFETIDAEVREAMERNIFEFSGAKTLSAALELNQLLYKDGQYREFADFKNEVAKIDSQINVNYLRAEYNHAVAVGLSTRKWNKLIAEKDDIPYWQYQTIGDERVRDSHAVLNGNVYAIDDIDAQKIFPPNGYGCRCEDIQYLGSNPTLSKGIEGYQILKDQQTGKDFLVNFAEERVLFTNNMKAISGLTVDKVDKFLMDIYSLDYKAYGLDEKPRSKEKLILTDKSRDDVEKEFKTEPNKNFVWLGDYYGRGIKFNKATLLDPKTKKESYKIIDNIPNIINSPDEVWYSVNKNNNPTLTYLKSYKDQSMIVKTGIPKNQKDAYNLITWFINEDDSQNRLGLRIK